MDSHCGSKKRHIADSRGLRGVGRLVGLGYCRSPSFKSKSNSDSKVKEAVWDCVRMKNILGNASYNENLEDVIKEICTVSYWHTQNVESFFEVKLENVLRVNNDILLNGSVVKTI